MPGTPIIEVGAGGEIQQFSNENVLRYAYVINTMGCDEFQMDVMSSWDNWKGPDYLVDPITLQHGLLDDKRSPKFDCVVTGAKETYGIKVSIVANGFGSGWLLHEVSAGGKIFRQKTISDIVREIAEDNEFVADVEETSGKFDLAGSGYTLAEFLMNECLPRAGANYYCCFRPGKKLIFKKFNPGGVEKYGMDNLALQPFTQYTRDVRSNFWTTVGWNTSSDTPVVTDMNMKKSNVKPFATEGFEFDKVVRLKTLGSHARSNTFRVHSQGLFSSQEPWMHKLILPVYGDPELVPPFMVEADIRMPGLSIVRHTRGKYMVDSVVHLIAKDQGSNVTYVTYLICNRRGFA